MYMYDEMNRAFIRGVDLMQTPLQEAEVYWMSKQEIIGAESQARV